MSKLTSLAPILPKDPAILIVGSMPSIKSLEKQEYYGNPRNHFWDILFEIFNQKPLLEYDDKLAFIKRHRIALWDTIGSCYRDGSLDSAIMDEEPNDIAGLLDEYPAIQLIACNGTKSFQTFKKYFDLSKLRDVDVRKMPSTSPIPGRYTKTFAGKVEEWQRILDYL
ncbi:DNA-deoxyinosine glycosylase [Virgibacillus oceani]|uniref:DNA-deoxyinosine glycosylase n=1 Tax=Virgibacillus oceani TaxID=1479511 RepID=A0A917HQX8_9BACI|nr:DNA-deoxyinosine glycosylase [Virgibacillus oceani]GGG86489.1 DNA-deoxyinosine glycosylase [Virgibacillus oceani]